MLSPFSAPVALAAERIVVVPGGPVVLLSVAPPRKPRPLALMPAPPIVIVVCAWTATTPPRRPSHAGATIEPTPEIVTVVACGTRITSVWPAVVYGLRKPPQPTSRLTVVP